MIFRHDDEPHRYGRVRLIRDLIEIAAIVAAGFWAFYVFAYENRIKPSLSQPELVFAVTMNKTAVRDGLVAVQINTSVKNVGQVQAHFLGYALWVYGRKVQTKIGSATVLGDDSRRTFVSPFFGVSRRVAVYGNGYITSLGNPNTTADLVINPGESEATQDVFFVPQGRFDLLDAYLLTRYTKYDRVTPTRLEIGPLGLPLMRGDRTGNFDYDNFISRIVL